MRDILKHKYILVLLLVLSSVSADIFNVNNLSDGVDAIPGDGVCEVNIGVGDCTLRAAINEANQNIGFDEVHLGVGIHDLTLLGEESAGFSGDLDIYDASGIAISGVSSEQTIINANDNNRVFNISNQGFYSFSYLTLTGGAAQSTTSFTGGGIAIGGNDVNVVIDNVVFFDNSANAGGAISISNGANVSISNSLFESNFTENLGFTNLNGPAIFCNSCQLLKIESSTFVENNQGGKAIELSNGNLEMLNSTMSNNEGGGVRTTNSNAKILFSTFYNEKYFGQNLSHFSFDDSHVVTIEKSAMHMNSANNINCQSGDLFASLGYNIVSDDSCSFEFTGDQQNVNLLLSELNSYGGNTPTHSPNVLSPVINSVPIIECNDWLGIPLIKDQRGFERPLYSLCDSGSIEKNTDIIFANSFE